LNLFAFNILTKTFISKSQVVIIGGFLMILHCTPPYDPYIPNAAIGYLKGSLQAKGIPVKNVYWNVILFKEITALQNVMGKYPIISNFSLNYTTAFYIGRHLLMGNAHSGKTPLDVIFSSLLLKEEISEIYNEFKDKIDHYIKLHNLHKTDLAGFTLKTHQWVMNYYIITRLKEINPDITVVIGGLSNSADAHTFLKVFPLVDFAIWGEGEYPLYSLVKAIAGEIPLEDVPHVAYRSDGITSTTAAVEPCSLDEYSFADHSDYFEALTQVDVQMPTLIPVRGSIGCLWNKCKFCVVNEEYTYRTRSPESIVQELEYQYTTHDIDHFVFVDSDLAGDKKRFRILLNMLANLSKKRGKPYHLYAETSPIFINAETARIMERISFDLIQVGFEAATDALLKKMQKRHRFAHNIQALKFGGQHNIDIKGNVMGGIPTETREDILESCKNLKFLRFLLKDYPVLPNIFSLYKGSAFYNEILELEKKNWKESPLWAEISPLNLIPEEDRFTFFGFLKNDRSNYVLWKTFEKLLRFYAQKNSSYQWVEYADYSVIKETGVKTGTYTLNRDETDVLVYCDSVRSLSDIKKQIHLPEHDLLDILHRLNELGLLYHDKNFDTIISVVEAAKIDTKEKLQ
jgi:anaerobic magnesium-protoporphyrin IX monomethyl ester cyclase